MANASSSSASANITANITAQAKNTNAPNITGGNVPLTSAGDVTTVSSSLTTLRTDSGGGDSGGSTIDITLYAGIAGGVVALVLAIIGAMVMLQNKNRKFAPTPMVGNALEPPLNTLDDDEGEDGGEGDDGGEDEGDEGGEGGEGGEDEGGEGGDGGAGDDDDPSDSSQV